AWLSAALLRRLAKVDATKIQTPPSYIAGQVLLQLPFCAEQDQLREMYANLLASAMQKDRVAEVHPAYVQIIQQLSPDEALILQALSTDSNSLRLYEAYDNRGNALDRTESISISFRHYCEGVGAVDPSSSDTYLDNLLRLRIFYELNWTEGE